MQSITNCLELLATLTQEAEAIANCLDDLRQRLPDDDWETIVNSPIGELVYACMDLESIIEALNS